MAGVAAQMCGDRNVVIELGYQVKPDGTIFQEEIDEDGKKNWVAFSKLGVRRTVLNDLSPAATFIAYNYNTPVDVASFEKEAKKNIKEVEKECGWMFETLHSDNKTKATMDYTVWSEVFCVQNVVKKLSFLRKLLDEETRLVKDEFNCPHCGSLLRKKGMNRAFEVF